MSSENGNGIEALEDGQLDWSGGVSSQRVATIRSPDTPNGLARNQLAWLINGSVRTAGITPRNGWFDLGKVHPGALLFQGAILYKLNTITPYWLASIGGHIWKIDPDNPTAAVDLSAAFGLVNPAGAEKAYLCQGEEFVIIQAGDNATLPLIWDNATLRRSNGITGNTDPNLGPVNEIPAGTAMDYFMGRLWYAQGRTYSAGDIVKGSAGTLAYGFRDAILKVTENPLAIGGDGFAPPTQAGGGNIRALHHDANLNTTLGQGQLYIFTTKAICALSVPVTRADWINATEPFQRVVQLASGAVSENSVVNVNGDLFYQALDPAIRSLMVAVRYFGQWANPPVSTNINRLIKANDRSLLHMGSGMVFDERLIETALPIRSSVGVVHRALAVLDFNPLGSFEQSLGDTSNQPVWEGAYEGLKFIQVGAGDFGGRDRAFAFCLELDNSIHLWELTDYAKFEQDDKRITMIAEFPAFTFKRENTLKKLVGGRLWVDQLYGSVVFKLEYRPDGDNCWHIWNEWQDCTARSSAEDYFDPLVYPETIYGDSYRNFAFPKPQPEQNPAGNSLANIAYQFQVRLTIRGFCRVRGLILCAEIYKRGLYKGLTNSRLNQPLAPQIL